MASIDVRLDRGGIRAVLNSGDVGAAINGLAHQIASNVQAANQRVANDDELPVVVDEYTTDRTAASVTLAHPAGLAVQAKHGLLTKAAASAGLEVKAR